VGKRNKRKKKKKNRITLQGMTRSGDWVTIAGGICVCVKNAPKEWAR